MFIGHLDVFSYQEGSVQVFDPISIGRPFLLITRRSSSPLSDACVANNFSCPVFCLFVVFGVF